MPRKRIQEGEKVPVRFTAREKELLVEHTLADTEYSERLQPVPGSTDFVGPFTLDDLEDILGYIAAEANHTENRKLQRALDALFDKLSGIQASCDDGNWQESGT